ncbi:MAG: glycosyltransferase [Bacillota bacterium]
MVLFGLNVDRPIAEQFFNGLAENGVAIRGEQSDYMGLQTEKITNYPVEYRDIEPLFLSPAEFNLLLRGGPPTSGRPSTDTVIVYPPTINWNFMKQRPQQLMEQFARHGHSVYYCNKIGEEGRPAVEIKPNLTLVDDNKAFIREAIPELKRQGKKVLVWTSWSKLHPFLEQYLPDFIVYDYVDDFPAWEPYLDKMVGMSDLVVTTASSLKIKIEQRFRSKPTYLVRNGCDIMHFRQYADQPPPKPFEYQEHQGPIISYVGAWAGWIDQELVKRLAQAFPQALISVIGVEFGITVDRSIPNLRFVGYKFYESLPQYLHYADVCIIPFKLNRISLATNPVKMYEYLAAGKPVVTTDLPEARNTPGVHVAKDYQSFIAGVGRILSPSFEFEKEAIYRWLAGQTWECRYKHVRQILDKHLEGCRKL